MAFHLSTQLIDSNDSKIDDHGVRRGDTERILDRWRHPVASRVALDLPYWTMRSVPYHLIRMAIEMAREAGQFFSVIDFMSCITIAKRPWYGQLKIKPRYYCSSLCIKLVSMLWRPADSNKCRFGYHCRRRAEGVLYLELKYILL